MTQPQNKTCFRGGNGKKKRAGPTPGTGRGVSVEDVGDYVSAAIKANPAVYDRVLMYQIVKLEDIMLITQEYLAATVAAVAYTGGSCSGAAAAASASAAPRVAEAKVKEYLEQQGIVFQAGWRQQNAQTHADYHQNAALNDWQR